MTEGKSISESVNTKRPSTQQMSVWRTRTSSDRDRYSTSEPLGQMSDLSDPAEDTLSILHRMSLFAVNSGDPSLNRAASSRTAGDPTLRREKYQRLFCTIPRIFCVSGSCDIRYFEMASQRSDKPLISHNGPHRTLRQVKPLVQRFF